MTDKQDVVIASQCKACGDVLPVEDLYTDDDYPGWCVDCVKEYKEYM